MDDSFDSNLYYIHQRQRSMGANGSSDPNKPIDQNPTTQTQKSNMLISPQEAYAIKLKEKNLIQLFPDLVRVIEKVKKIQNYEGVSKIVQGCPIYFLKHLGCFYQGQWLDCLPHGCGISVYKNNSYYEGEFKKGELVSDDALYYFGSQSISDNIIKTATKTVSEVKDRKEEAEEPKKEEVGTYFIGRFQKSKFNGKGKLSHKGLIYEGQWENGRRQGNGKQYSVEQSYSYEGQFVNSFKYGQGIYTKRLNNQIYCYEGSFYSGKFHGLGKLSVDGSEMFRGRFYNGKAEGQGTLHCQQGTLKGTFQKDRVKGNGEFTYNDSTKEPLQGIFSQQLSSNGKTRKIYCQGKLITEAINIDYDTLMPM